MKRIILVILTLSLISTACYFNMIKGSGNVIQEERELNQFNEIGLRGTGTVILTQGDVQKVTITTDDNIMDLVQTNVKNGKLIIYTEGNIMHYTKFDIDITIPEIKAISVSGSGDVVSNEQLQCDDLELNVSGSGEIVISVNAEDIEASISGSGEIALQGEAGEVETRISGSGNMKARELTCKDASIRVSGSGNCRINATENLDVKVSGSGNVYYYGNPDISTNVSGSGSVQKRSL
jgi:predicted small secreted protein